MNLKIFLATLTFFGIVAQDVAIIEPNADLVNTSVFYEDDKECDSKACARRFCSSELRTFILCNEHIRRDGQTDFPYMPSDLYDNIRKHFIFGVRQVGLSFGYCQIRRDFGINKVHIQACRNCSGGELSKVASQHLQRSAIKAFEIFVDTNKGLQQKDLEVADIIRGCPVNFDIVYCPSSMSKYDNICHDWACDAFDRRGKGRPKVDFLYIFTKLKLNKSLISLLNHPYRAELSEEQVRLLFSKVRYEDDSFTNLFILLRGLTDNGLKQKIEDYLSCYVSCIESEMFVAEMLDNNFDMTCTLKISLHYFFKNHSLEYDTGWSNGKLPDIDPVRDSAFLEFLLKSLKEKNKMDQAIAVYSDLIRFCDDMIIKNNSYGSAKRAKIDTSPIVKMIKLFEEYIPVDLRVKHGHSKCCSIM